MLNIEDITAGMSIKGLAGKGTVKIIAVKHYGKSAAEITYKDNSGRPASSLLYPEDCMTLEAAGENLAWNFTGDGNIMRLVSEAYRFSLAYIFDPYIAVHTSEIEPLPHQIAAVYQEMLPRLPLRYVLADDPGAGKTIMTGLLLKELLIRGDLRKCLIVSPGSLAEQWQEELSRKFHLKFSLLNDDTDADFAIARLDKLARSEELQQKLQAQDWDIIVVDEAHKMSASVTGNDIHYTKRFRLGQLLSGITRHFLLLTATPHNGKEKDFRLFMSLVDSERFGAVHSDSSINDVSDVMRRLLKEELRKFDGTPLFPERRAYTVSYKLSPLEARLYDEVTDYVRNEFNKADRLNGKRRNAVGFALTILQRRLASSPEAIYQSLKRRHERLTQEQQGTFADDYDEDDYTSAQIESREDYAVDYVSASSTSHELEQELAVLEHLIDMADEVRKSGDNKKWNELSLLLQDNKNMFGADGQREKLIIFTEHKDTLFYLNRKISALLGDPGAVVSLHGGISRDERRKIEDQFMNDDTVRILTATDAAGEGINLQRAHLMVNYDLPWNPNRLEQRFGRIHRIGQDEVCHLWNLVATDTREGSVFQRLFDKLEQERAALGGKVFDVLGKITFNDKSLSELLVEAIRYGNDPAVRNRLNEAVDNSLTREHLLRLLEERALTEDTIDIARIRGDMTRTDARRLQPYFTGSFFIEAFRKLGGRILQKEKGRYKIAFIPMLIRSHSSLIPERYDRVCFDKSLSRNAELITPGHPLLEAVISCTLERYSGTLRQGTVFIDDSDNTQARLLFCIEDAIRDGTDRVISRHISFIEITSGGTARNAGYAPYLDYRAATPQEQDTALTQIRPQFTGDPEASALDYAITNIVPEHLQQARTHRLALLDKTARAVDTRMTEEIRYWDTKASELREKEREGKPAARLNSQNAEKRADDLDERRKFRLEEIKREKIISALPPVVVSGALIVPACLVNDTPTQHNSKAIELAAMNAVMRIEQDAGYSPRDVSSLKCGYDIESGDDSGLRFIEVKGRAKGAETVTVTAGEIRTALNCPDEFVLAVVEVDGQNTRAIYLKQPFTSAPDFGAASVNYSISELVRKSVILYEER